MNLKSTLIIILIFSIILIGYPIIITIINPDFFTHNTLEIKNPNPLPNFHYLEDEHNFDFYDYRY